MESKPLSNGVLITFLDYCVGFCMGLNRRSCVRFIVDSDLSVKEARLINVIGGEGQNQRTIAQEMGFSLGMTNILLKKLVNTGYVKVTHLNGRSLRYMLTPQGFKEKLRRTQIYFQDSIRRLKHFKTKLMEHVLESKVGEVIVLGEGDIFDLSCEILADRQVLYRSFAIVDQEEITRLVIQGVGDKIMIISCDLALMNMMGELFSDRVVWIDAVELMA